MFVCIMRNWIGDNDDTGEPPRFNELFSFYELMLSNRVFVLMLLNKHI